MSNKYNKAVTPDAVPNEFSMLDGKALEDLISLKDRPEFLSLLEVLGFLDQDLRRRDWMTRSFKDTDAVFDSGVRHGQVTIIQLLSTELWDALAKELQRRKEQIDKGD